MARSRRAMIDLTRSGRKVTVRCRQANSRRGAGTIIDRSRSWTNVLRRVTRTRTADVGMSTHNDEASVKRRSPLHDLVARQGARFGLSCGWAYPLWFGGRAETSPADRALAHATEHLLTRRTVGIFDVSLLSQILVIGLEGVVLLNRLSTSNIDVEVGRVVYTQWCNDDGLIQADVIIARLRTDRFMVVVGDTVQQRCMDLLNAAVTKHHNVAEHTNVHVVDVTSAYAVITIAGPKAEAVMGHLAADPVPTSAFAPMRVRDMVLAGRPSMVMTVSYTGERSFEAHVPAEYAAALYTDITTAAAAEGGGPCGIDAMYSLGTENGSLDYDYDLDGTVTPLEAGLGRLVAWDKVGGFVGREALDRQRQSGPLRTRIIGARTTPAGDRSPAPFQRGDIVYRHDVAVGRVLSGTIGHTVNAAVGMLKLHHVDGITDRWLDADWHIDHHGTRLPVTLFSGRLHATALEASSRH